ncbi:SAM-dependent methyltransferase [Opitutaceae bacterium TAV3]|nr:SAM-dependent methyltransferase [Opitutaceae bacterium TAV3]
MSHANDPLSRFTELLSKSITDGTLVKLTLGKPLPAPGSDAPADPALRNLFVRPVTLKSGPHLSFVWRYDTRDITKNHPPAAALDELSALLGATFGDAHLFTPAQNAQLQTLPGGRRKLSIKTACEAPPPAATEHDRTKTRAHAADAPWLRALGVTNDHGQPREGMTGKFRQIQKFTELLTHLLADAGLVEPATPTSPIRIADMGCGKGYLTFALAALLGPRAAITGIERRADLVLACNQIAQQHGFTPGLQFAEGEIAATVPDASVSEIPLHPSATTPAASAAGGSLDVLIALHACNTATDDALAAGIAAGARLLVVSPCCHQELRPQLTPPPPPPPPTFNVQRSAFNVQCSALDVGCST